MTVPPGDPLIARPMIPPRRVAHNFYRRPRPQHRAQPGPPGHQPFTLPIQQFGWNRVSDSLFLQDARDKLNAFASPLK